MGRLQILALVCSLVEQRLGLLILPVLQGSGCGIDLCPQCQGLVAGCLRQCQALSVGCQRLRVFFLRRVQIAKVVQDGC